MKKRNTTILLTSLCCMFGMSAFAAAEENTPVLTLATFISEATKNDTRFEEILIDKLPLQYRRDALLPTKDLLVSLKQEFHLFLNPLDVGGRTTVSLAQLFPDSGTQLSTAYNKPATTSGNHNASLQFLISQPIAENAYGRNYKLQDQLIGVANDIVRYQIVEAYEDYLASLTTVWYNWFSAWENLKVSRTSYQSNEKLLENILERKRQKIALPIDVNKMKLSLIRKQENIVVLQEIFDNLSNLIFSAMRLPPGQRFIPATMEINNQTIVFEEAYQRFVNDSRTYHALELLEKKSSLAVDKAADDLLPSTNLLLGYQMDAEYWGIKPQQNSFFAGISLDWPVKNSVDKAKLSIARAEKKKTVLSKQNKYEELHTNLKNIHLQIQREQELMTIAEQKIKLAESILKDETENYSFGKVSLNDYIDAVNDVDENRFSRTDHSVKLNKLLIEWHRLTDTLLDKTEGLDSKTLLE
ncbi:MAG: TolC family protein [Gammaproteobacteria bacterium]|nr:TolC family protein [Gammaproteobacteria bacterium]